MADLGAIGRLDASSYTIGPSYATTASIHFVGGIDTVELGTPVLPIVTGINLTQLGIPNLPLVTGIQGTALGDTSLVMVFPVITQGLTQYGQPKLTFKFPITGISSAQIGAVTSSITTVTSYYTVPNLWATTINLQAPVAALPTIWTPLAFVPATVPGVRASHTAPYAATTRISAAHSSPYVGRVANAHTASYATSVVAVHAVPYTGVVPVAGAHAAVHDLRQGEPLATAHTASYAASVRAAHQTPYEGSLRVRAQHQSSHALRHTVASQHQSVYVATTRLVADFTQVYDLSLLDRITTQHAGFWSLQPDGASIFTLSAALSAAGRDIAIEDAVLTASRNTPYWELQARVLAPEDYAVLNDGQAITFTIGSEAFSLVVAGKSLSRDEGGAPDMQVVARSPVFLLDTPRHPMQDYYIDQPMMASAVVEAILGQPVTWNTVDWLLPAGKVALTRSTPVAAATTIVQAIGAHLRSEADGTLSVVSEFPVSWPRLDTAALDHTFTDTEDNISVTSKTLYAPKVNYLRISEGEVSFNDQLDWELDEGSLTSGTLHLRPSPWRTDLLLDDTQQPKTTNYSLVGVVEETVEETVEFRKGQANLGKPIFAMGSVTWMSDPLGAVTWAEGSTSLSSGIGVNEGYGVATVTYTTRTIDYRVSGVVGTQVQFLVRSA